MSEINDRLDRLESQRERQQQRIGEQSVAIGHHRVFADEREKLVRVPTIATENTRVSTNV